MSRRFSRVNQPRKCTGCGKLTTDNAGGGTGLCGRCFEAAGLANEHEDGYHDESPHPDCPTCQEAVKAAEDAIARRKA